MEKIAKHSFSEFKNFGIDETGESGAVDYSLLINNQMLDSIEIFNRLFESKIKIGLNGSESFAFGYNNGKIEKNDIRDVTSIEYKDYIAAQQYMINEKSDCTFITAA